MRNLVSEGPSANQESFASLHCGVLQIHQISQALLESAHLFVLVHADGLARASADQAICLLLVGQSGYAQTGLAQILHVVVHALIDAGQEFDRFVDARC